MTNIIIALYFRVSHEDSDLDGFKYESNSISNQRKLLRDFVYNNDEFKNFHLIEIADDGYSGTNFERPGIIYLFKMIKENKINCVIVKDLSRFGRNYIEVGNYIEEIFPLYNIRFISINDNYDSFKDNSKSIELGFKNVIYDIYSKDLSLKIKTSRKSTAQQGKFTATYAPYGYKKSFADKHKLEIDKEVSMIVEMIFQMFLNNYSVIQIAKKLNETKILPPSLYKEKVLKCGKWKDKNKTIIWTDATVRRILKDEVYIGNIVSHKVETKKVGSNKKKIIQRKDRIVVQNMHMPIIKRKDFDIIQSKFKLNSSNLKAGISNRIFYKELKCGTCKHALKRNGSKNFYYFCRNRFMNNNINCFKENITEKELENIIFIYLKKLIYIYMELKKQKYEFKNDNLILHKKYIVQNNKATLFESFCNEEISEIEYIMQNNKLSLENENLINILKYNNDKAKSTNYVQNYYDIDRINKQVIQKFIKSIYVFSNKKLQIIFKMKDYY